MASQHSSFKSASICQNPMLAMYQSKMRQQTQFLNFVREALAEPLAEHVLYCVISSKKLLLYTDAEEWAVQLRCQLPIILTAIGNSTLAVIDAIQVRIISPQKEARVTRKANLPSKKNIELIHDNLQAIKDDELKAALLRLSQTLNRLS